MRGTPIRRTLVATAVLALAAAGCGARQSPTGVASVATASGKPAATPTATTTANPEEQARKFAQCMRDHGVDMPDPEPGAGGGVKVRLGKQGDEAKTKKAFEACKEFSPVKQRGQIKPEDVEKMRAFAACMRENGVDMPDPEPNGGFVAGGGPRRGFKPDDPTFKKAFEACRDTSPMKEAGPR
ncbi:hypothetical protein [Nonomuraea lactucae]|uniref:hypothetical protein n=1 Tax=Nonomuraea lactucae TaxID=2249762 RepID=UPI0013B472DE|nr:hypothetical protein [Nonomuraea lactucae]